jgi:DNA/RNA-binding domain of Phe-tRNA-synthetase-like protein
MTSLAVDQHPLLVLSAFRARFPRPLGDLPTPESLRAMLRADAPAPLERDEAARVALRDLLRHGGYKPTGRGKPSSEYLVRAALDETLQPINLAVDACNAVSLHSGLPISVVDLERTRGALRVGLAGEGASYVFNAAGQTLDLAGLLCLFDEDGPCANAVKDAQRTKTHARTLVTLSIVWAARGLEERLARAVGWYRELLSTAGASTAEV